MELRLLGPVEVWNEGQQVSLGGAKPQSLLAALLLEAGRVVTVDRLIEAIWEDDPPTTARGVLQTYVASLRRAFTGAGLPDVIVSHRLGYLAEIPRTSWTGTSSSGSSPMAGSPPSRGGTRRRARPSVRLCDSGVARPWAGSAARTCARKPYGWKS
ncbi:AfsR/SARP family transcriptional regulator [Nonomuraea jabiensis]|uniref:AfsR/SARP family transcriptional regulator n=1 Tax=Nonomuraea jabiensis TaxID=882448 RepID=UPI003D75C98F